MNSDLIGAIFDGISNNFGEDIEYVYKDGTRFPIKGPYFSEFKVFDEGQGVEVVSDSPGYEIKLSDITRYPIEGDKIEVSGKKYKVIDVKSKEKVLALVFIREIV